MEKRCPITLSKKAKFRAEGPAPPVSVPALGALPKQAGFVIGPLAVASRLFPGSSVVEQPAVNRLVAGSNPARGAKLKQRLVPTSAL